jgi:hypothetical protein
LGFIQTLNWKPALAFNRGSFLELDCDSWWDDFSALVQRQKSLDAVGLCWCLDGRRITLCHLLVLVEKQGKTQPDTQRSASGEIKSTLIAVS